MTDGIALAVLRGRNRRAVAAYTRRCYWRTEHLAFVAPAERVFAGMRNVRLLVIREETAVG